MSLKKYQVFISSTFEDLKVERQQVAKFLIKGDCIPVGMEFFNASSQPQFTIIKKLLDITDYFVLIIGKRYGSISKSTGISYTEMEYDYAVEHGIPVLAFLYDLGSSSDNIEDNLDNNKLEEFRKKVKEEKEVNFWSEPVELLASICTSIQNEIKNVQRPGWIRYEESGPNPQKQLEELQKEYYELSIKKNNSNVGQKQRAYSDSNDLTDILKRKCNLVLGSKVGYVRVEPKLTDQTKFKIFFDVVINDYKTKTENTVKVSLLNRNGWKYKVSHHYHGPKQGSPYFPGKEGCGSAAIDETLMDVANCLFLFYEVGSENVNWVQSKYDL